LAEDGDIVIGILGEVVRVIVSRGPDDPPCYLQPPIPPIVRNGYGHGEIFAWGPGGSVQLDAAIFGCLHGKDQQVDLVQDFGREFLEHQIVALRIE
jgi:hypothetical protein